jgi:hypothetical protein
MESKGIERTLLRYVLTNDKIVDTSDKITIRTRTDFKLCLKREVIEMANTIRELIEYCFENKIKIYTYDYWGNLTLLNENLFYEHKLAVASRLMLWKGKDLVCAYEFKKGEER